MVKPWARVPESLGMAERSRKYLTTRLRRMGSQSPVQHPALDLPPCRRPDITCMESLDTHLATEQSLGSWNG
jgi:hypothetical protein